MSVADCRNRKFGVGAAGSEPRAQSRGLVPACTSCHRDSELLLHCPDGAQFSQLTAASQIFEISICGSEQRQVVISVLRTCPDTGFWIPLPSARGTRLNCQPAPLPWELWGPSAPRTILWESLTQFGYGTESSRAVWQHFLTSA